MLRRQEIMSGCGTRQHLFSALMVLAAAIIAMGWPAPQTTALANDGYRVTGPYGHGNLAMYLMHRQRSDSAPVPLTLQEAMQQGAVTVIETGDVQELVVRNLGERDIFIQSGDMVKGGKQDRVLTVSMLISPNSGDVPVGAFCVEQGRWSARGQENAAAFSASTELAPSRSLRMALGERALREVAPGAESTAPRIGGRRLPQGGSLQYEVWDSVRRLQADLSPVAEADVADQRSPSSLQLSLENKALASALKTYEAALGGLVREHPGAVGYVFAINGRINSGSEFGSAGLFRKLWPRQLRAAATEALAEEGAQPGSEPTLAEVAAFIDGARAAEPVGKSMPGRMILEMRRTERSLYTEIRRHNGDWVHRSFIAYP